jgi:hypothetical protein
MEKIFKAKHLFTGEWHVFALNEPQENLDKNTICQYTGINDSQGQRIFEGDELSAKGEYNSIVKYGSGAFCIQHDTEWYSNWVSFRDIDLKAYTLTGHNIHDRG